MIVRPHAPLLTVAEYKNLPETGPRYQLIEGDLYMAPAPNRFHQDISRNLQGALDRYLETNPIGILYNAPFDVYLTSIDVFQPDLIVVLNPNRFYARLGVKELWIIDPEARTVAAHRFDQNPADPVNIWTEADTATTTLLPGFSTKVASIFRRP